MLPGLLMARQGLPLQGKVAAGCTSGPEGEGGASAWPVLVGVLLLVLRAWAGHATRAVEMSCRPACHEDTLQQRVYYAFDLCWGVVGSDGSRRLTLRHLSLMQQRPHRRGARSLEPPPQSGLARRSKAQQTEGMFRDLIRWQMSGGQDLPAWHRAPQAPLVPSWPAVSSYNFRPVPYDVLKRQQEADLERMLQAAERMPEGALLLASACDSRGATMTWAPALCASSSPCIHQALTDPATEAFKRLYVCICTSLGRIVAPPRQQSSFALNGCVLQRMSCLCEAHVLTERSAPRADADPERVELIPGLFDEMAAPLLFPQRQPPGQRAERPAHPAAMRAAEPAPAGPPAGAAGAAAPRLHAGQYTAAQWQRLAALGRAARDAEREGALHWPATDAASREAAMVLMQDDAAGLRHAMPQLPVVPNCVAFYRMYACGANGRPALTRLDELTSSTAWRSGGNKPARWRKMERFAAIIEEGLPRNDDGKVNAEDALAAAARIDRLRGDMRMPTFITHMFSERAAARNAARAAAAVAAASPAAADDAGAA